MRNFMQKYAVNLHVMSAIFIFFVALKFSLELKLKQVIRLPHSYRKYSIFDLPFCKLFPKTSTFLPKFSCIGLFMRLKFAIREKYS